MTTVGQRLALDRLPVALRPRPNGDVRHHTALERLCAFWALIYSHTEYGGQYVEVSRAREGGPFLRGGRSGWFERIPEGGHYERADLERIARRVLALAPLEHVYIGVLPRARQSSKSEAVVCARVLWADCDDKRPQSLAALRRFAPRPTIVVASGGGRHAYWLLDRPIEPRDARRMGAGVAHALDSDLVSDPQRSLRPPGTLNHKARYGTPRSVELLYMDPSLRLRSPDEFERFAQPPRPESRRAAAIVADPLAAIPPDVYVPALTGRDATQHKVRCPLHGGGEERTPSLHIHEEGWYCYGCQQGGGIYQLADLVQGGDGRPRGERFRALRTELSVLFPGVASPQPRNGRKTRSGSSVQSGDRPNLESRRSFGRKP
jgi:hypothetical protein